MFHASFNNKTSAKINLSCLIFFPPFSGLQSPLMFLLVQGIGHENFQIQRVRTPTDESTDSRKDEVLIKFLEPLK